MGRIFAGVPARMGSSRLKGKPLQRVLDRTLVEHVWWRVSAAESVDLAFVAGCDEEVRQVVEGIGGRFVMTDPDISRPGLRVGAALESLVPNDDDIVVVVQGDEPLIRPEMIDRAVEALLSTDDAICACLMAPCSEDEWLDPNEVKVLVDQSLRALFMSRSPIPSNTRDRVGPRFKQVCVFPFRVRGMREFYGLAETPYEICESIELLRAIEHGRRVQMVPTDISTKSVDTEDDRLQVERLMAEDPIYQTYRGNAIALLP